MRRRPAVALGALASAGALLLATGCAASPPELKVSGAFMPAPPTTDMAAGFLSVDNSGGTADTLTSVTSDVAESVEIHRTEGQTMKKADSFDVPAEGTLDMERGGNHMMFHGLSEKPVEGQKVTVKLHFEESGTITAELPVKSASYNPAAEEG